MRLVLISALAVAVLVLGTLSTTSEPATVESAISAAQGATLPERRAFNYIQRTPPQVVVESADEPERVVRSEPVVRARPERSSTPPPPPLPQPQPEVVAVPAVPPAVTACLGKFVGTRCTYRIDGSDREGTCMTPAWSPVTCVLH